MSPFSAAHRKSIEGLKKCVTCGLELKTESALLKHKNKVHRGMKFICDICNKEYVDYSILKRHKKNVHNVIMGRKLNFSTNKKDWFAQSILCPTITCKVHIFWEGHKILRNLHLTFDWHYLHRTKVRWRFCKMFGLLRIYEL